MYIKVKARPKAKEEKAVKIKDDEYEIYVKEKAKNNEANKRIIEILSKIFKSKRIKMIKGKDKKNKIFEIM